MSTPTDDDAVAAMEKLRETALVIDDTLDIDDLAISQVIELLRHHLQRESTSSTKESAKPILLALGSPLSCGAFMAMPVSKRKHKLIDALDTLVAQVAHLLPSAMGSASDDENDDDATRDSTGGAARAGASTGSNNDADDAGSSSSSSSSSSSDAERDDVAVLARALQAQGVVLKQLTAKIDALAQRAPTTAASVASSAPTHTQARVADPSPAARDDSTDSSRGGARVDAGVAAVLPYLDDAATMGHKHSSLTDKLLHAGFDALSVKELLDNVPKPPDIAAATLGTTQPTAPHAAKLKTLAPIITALTLAHDADATVAEIGMRQLVDIVTKARLEAMASCVSDPATRAAFMATSSGTPFDTAFIDKLKAARVVAESTKALDKIAARSSGSGGGGGGAPQSKSAKKRAAKAAKEAKAAAAKAAAAAATKSGAPAPPAANAGGAGAQRTNASSQ